MRTKIIVVCLTVLLSPAFANFDDRKLLVNDSEQANDAQQENSHKKLKLLPANMTINNNFALKEAGLSSLQDYDQSNFYYINLDLNRCKLPIDFDNDYINKQKLSTSKNIHEIRQQKFLDEMNKIPHMLMIRNRLNNRKSAPYMEYIYHINIGGAEASKVDH